MEVLSRASPHDPVVIEEGVGCVRTAVAVHPDKAFSHYVLAVAYHLFKNDPAASEPHYQKALELNPRFTFCMVNLSNILLDKGDAAGAEKMLRRAVETDPRFLALR